MANYSLHVYDDNGSKQFIITDFRELSYTRKVNDPGAIQFAIRGDHGLLTEIDDKWEFQVRRNGASEFNGIFRDDEWSYDEGQSVYRGFCLGMENQLSWRVINWTAGSTNRSSFSAKPAETVMKKLVEYNAGPAATESAGRKRAGSITGLTVESDASGGDIINWNCHGKNLLKTLKGIAEIGDGDFSLSRISSGSYSFRWHTSQLGNDLTASVIFGLDYGNMRNPFYKRTRSKEKTVASVWGQGEGASRKYVTVTGDNFGSANDIELYVDARNVELTNTSGLSAKGENSLEVNKSKDEFEFATMQTSGTQYRVDYDLGDLVKAINPFTSASAQVKVEEVTVTLNSDGNEDIDVILRTP